MLNELNDAGNLRTNQPVKPPGMLIVVSSPSGGGKGTLIDRVLKIVDGISYSVSYTTRTPRGSERNGHEYFFVSKAEFEEMVRHDEFLEWADVYGHFYGTHREQVERERASGLDIILEIDVQGAESIRRKVSEPVTVFILPPSFALLRERLVARNTDSPADLERRLRGAPGEVEQYKYFDYLVLNDDINRASSQLAAVIYAERARRQRQEVRLKETLLDFGLAAARGRT